MNSENGNTKLSLTAVQDALIEKIKTDTEMNSLDIKSNDISEPYVSIQSVQSYDSSSKTIESDTFNLHMYIVVKKTDDLNIETSIQMIQEVLGNLSQIDGVKTENCIKGKSVREDNTNKYAFLEIELKATYGYKCK